MHASGNRGLSPQDRQVITQGHRRDAFAEPTCGVCGVEAPREGRAGERLCLQSIPQEDP